MPTYDYLCEACGHRFSRIESMDTHGRAAIPCPSCRSKNVVRVLSAFFAKTAKKS